MSCKIFNVPMPWLQMNQVLLIDWDSCIVTDAFVIDGVDDYLYLNCWCWLVAAVYDSLMLLIAICSRLRVPLASELLSLPSSSRLQVAFATVSKYVPANRRQSRLVFENFSNLQRLNLRRRFKLKI